MSCNCPPCNSSDFIGDCLYKRIADLEAKLADVMTGFVTLSPSLANDPRPVTLPEALHVVEAEYHALVLAHAELETMVERAREAFYFIAQGHTAPGYKGEHAHPLVALAQEVIHGAQTAAREALAVLDAGKDDETHPHVFPEDVLGS